MFTGMGAGHLTPLGLMVIITLLSFRMGPEGLTAIAEADTTVRPTPEISSTSLAQLNAAQFIMTAMAATTLTTCAEAVSKLSKIKSF